MLLIWKINLWISILTAFNLSSVMPRKITEIKDFLLKARQKDAQSVKIIKAKDQVKFKVSS